MSNCSEEFSEINPLVIDEDLSEKEVSHDCELVFDSLKKKKSKVKKTVNRWTLENTKLLIALWKKYGMELEANPSRNKKAIYDKIASELQIIGNLSDYYNVSRCRLKIATLRNKCRQEMWICHFSGHSSKWIFYEDVHEIVGAFLKKVPDSGFSVVPSLSANPQSSLVLGLPTLNCSTILSHTPLVNANKYPVLVQSAGQIFLASNTMATVSPDSVYNIDKTSWKVIQNSEEAIKDTSYILSDIDDVELNFAKEFQYNNVSLDGMDSDEPEITCDNVKSDEVQSSEVTQVPSNEVVQLNFANKVQYTTVSLDDEESDATGITHIKNNSHEVQRPEVTGTPLPEVSQDNAKQIQGSEIPDEMYSLLNNLESLAKPSTSKEKIIVKKKNNRTAISHGQVSLDYEIPGHDFHHSKKIEDVNGIKFEESLEEVEIIEYEEESPLQSDPLDISGLPKSEISSNRSTLELSSFLPGTTLFSPIPGANIYTIIPDSTMTFNNDSGSTVVDKPNSMPDDPLPTARVSRSNENPDITGIIFNDNTEKVTFDNDYQTDKLNETSSSESLTKITNVGKENSDPLEIVLSSDEESDAISERGNATSNQDEEMYEKEEELSASEQREEEKSVIEIDLTDEETAEVWCKKCNCSFVSLQKYNQHYYVHHILPIPQTKFSKLKCNSCSSVRNSNRLLTTHYLLEHQEVFCNSCDSNFAGSVAFERHCKEVHDGISQNKLYCCKMCDMSLENFEKFQSHWVHVHGPDALRQFKCRICSNSYSSAYHLKRHQQFHTKHHLKYKCNDCLTVFPSLSALRKHYQKCGSKIYFKCDDCKLQFVTKEKLDFHYKTAHNIQFKCPICNSPFCERNTFLLHIIQKHSGDIGSTPLQSVVSEDKAGTS